MNVIFKCLAFLALLPLTVHSKFLSHVVIPPHSTDYTIEERDAHFKNFVEWNKNESSCNDIKYEHAYQTVMCFWYSGYEERKKMALSALEQVTQNHPKHKIISEILSDYRHSDELA